MHRAPAQWLGYDPRLLRELPVADRHALDWLAFGVMLGCCSSSVPLGYFVWLTVHRLSLACALAAASFGLLFAIVRLSVAGGPYAAGARSGGDSGPLLVLAAAATLAAQPAQLFVMRDALASARQAHRATLVASHQASGGCAQRDDCARYRTQLQRCEFVALQLQTLWSRPAGALRGSVLYVCVVLLPAALARSLAGSALRRYRRRRLRQARALLRVARLRDLAEVERALRMYRSHVARGRERDARDPLRAPWPDSRRGQP